MGTIRNSLVAGVSLLIAAGAIVALTPLPGEGQGPATSQRGPRRFYLTPRGYDGNETLTACATGFHMASLWEIFDPTQLRYDTALGYAEDDSGLGPPSAYGWIRTGLPADAASDPYGGAVNCNAWTSDYGFHEGSAVALAGAWHLDHASTLIPWTATIGICSDPARVWCVQD